MLLFELPVQFLLLLEALLGHYSMPLLLIGQILLGLPEKLRRGICLLLQSLDAPNELGLFFFGFPQHLGIHAHLPALVAGRTRPVALLDNQTEEPVHWGMSALTRVTLGSGLVPSGNGLLLGVFG